MTHEEDNAHPTSKADDSGTRYVYLVGDVDESSVASAIERIFTLAEEDTSRAINLVINTSGGSIYDAFALHDAIKFSPAPIRTIGLGKIMSAGCLLLAAGAKGERRIGKNASLMFHAGRDFHHGDLFELQTELAEFARIEQLYDDLIAALTCRTIHEVRALYLPDRKNNYMTAEQALAFGFVDMIF